MRYQITHFHYNNQIYYIDKIVEFTGKLEDCMEYQQYKDSVKTLFNSNGTPIHFVYKELDRVYNYDSINKDTDADMRIPKHKQ